MSGKGLGFAPGLWLQGRGALIGESQRVASPDQKRGIQWLGMSTPSYRLSLFRHRFVFLDMI